jgi:hypothetical protein
MSKDFKTRANEVYTTLTSNAGKLPEDTLGSDGQPVKVEGQLSAASIRENILIDMKTAVKEMDSIRAGSPTRKAANIDLGLYIKEKWGFAPDDNGSPDSFYHAIGVNPTNATVSSLMTMPDFDEGFRWLIPEVIREAIRLGLRKPALYPNLIASEQNVAQPSGIIMPRIDMSSAMPRKMGEAETFSSGTMSFNQKTVALQKIGMGIKMTDEVRDYVNINVLGIYMQDMGVKMNMAMDTLAISTLINGDGNGNAIPVVGVTTATALVYEDLLRVWVRMGLLGRMPQGGVSNENIALEIFKLPEFKGMGNNIGNIQGANITKLNVRTPIPASQNFDIHGAMPVNNQLMLIDATAALIKLNSAALRVETERIAERQLNGTYASMTTGFATLFDDARIMIDKSVTIGASPFPSYMDVSAYIAAQSFGS